MRSCDHGQRGIALLMAMLVVALTTVTAVSLVHEQSLSIRKSAHIQAGDAALMYSLALEDFARLILREDAKDSKTDSLDEHWATEGGIATPIEGGFLAGAMMDAQSLLNVNAVGQKEVEDRLRVLCNNLDVSPDFIPALKDWLDSDLEIVDPEGAEDDYYTSLDPPYRAANRPLSDLSELLLIKGMTREIFDKLRDHITALPGSTNLNINTMSAELYQTLDKDLDAEKFIADREKDPFDSLEDYKKRMNHPALIEKGLSVASEYFFADGQITRGDKTLLVRSLIHRDAQGGTRVLYRRLGGF